MKLNKELKNFLKQNPASIIAALILAVSLGVSLYSKIPFSPKSIEIAAVPVSANSLEQGFITPASCGTIYGDIIHDWGGLGPPPFTGLTGERWACSYTCPDGTVLQSLSGSCPPPPPPPPPQSPPPSCGGSWTFCAQELQFCSFSGTAQVRFGENNSYNYGTFTNGVQCHGDNFGGDPIFGVVKHCDYACLQSPPPPPLSASCSVSPSSALTNQTVIWTASPSGGIGSYGYSWSGTDGLSGSSQSVQKSYSSAGIKSGSITVTSGSQQISVSCNNSATIANPAPTIGGGAGGSCSGFCATPSTIGPGGSSVLSWSSTNATSCSIDQGVGSVPTTGTKTISPLATTEYTLTCAGPGGTATAKTTVTILPVPKFKEIAPE